RTMRSIFPQEGDHPTVGFRGRCGRLPTPAGPIRFLQTMEFEPTPAGTTLHYRFAAPTTRKERAIMEQMAPWLEDAMRTSATRLTEQLDEELERRGRDATDQPAPPRTQPA